MAQYHNTGNCGKSCYRITKKRFTVVENVIFKNHKNSYIDYCHKNVSVNCTKKVKCKGVSKGRTKSHEIKHVKQLEIAKLTT